MLSQGVNFGFIWRVAHYRLVRGAKRLKQCQSANSRRDGGGHRQRWQRQSWQRERQGARCESARVQAVVSWLPGPPQHRHQVGLRSIRAGGNSAAEKIATAFPPVRPFHWRAPPPPSSYSSPTIWHFAADMIGTPSGKGCVGRAHDTAKAWGFLCLQSTTQGHSIRSTYPQSVP